MAPGWYFKRVQLCFLWDKDGPLESTEHGFCLTLSQQKDNSEYLSPLPVDTSFMHGENRSNVWIFMFNIKENSGSGQHAGKNCWKSVCHGEVISAALPKQENIVVPVMWLNRSEGMEVPRPCHYFCKKPLVHLWWFRFSLFLASSPFFLADHAGKCLRCIHSLPKNGTGVPVQAFCLSRMIWYLWTKNWDCV